MRIGYFGNPALSARLLESLLSKADLELIFVVSNPDKPQKRSGEAVPSAVSALVRERAKGKHLKAPLLLQAPNIKDPAFITQLKKLQADLFVVFAYGHILPPEILALSPRGAINLHASLLPQLRGASPIQSAILRGLDKTGWTVQYISHELDLGDIICQKEIAILPDENAGELGERMLPAGIELVLQSLEQIAQSPQKIQALSQNHKEGSYCHKIQKKYAQIPWQSSAQEIHNCVRAYNPSPLSWTLLERKKLKIYRTSLIANSEMEQAGWQKALPGSLGLSPDAKELWVKTGQGLLSILELQLENRRHMLAREFLNGYRQTLKAKKEACTMLG